MREMEIGRDGRVLRVRDVGEPDGTVVMYFHGTPGSRLDLCFGEQLVADASERHSFERKGVYDVRVQTRAGKVVAELRGHSHTLEDRLVERVRQSKP